MWKLVLHKWNLKIYLTVSDDFPTIFRTGDLLNRYTVNKYHVEAPAQKTSRLVIANYLKITYNMNCPLLIGVIG
ncbi:hypothetical protein MR857_01205 [bacterium]|nr:hypothetical protein [bacterium]